MTTVMSEINRQREDEEDEGANRDEVGAEAVIEVDVLVVIKVIVRMIRTRSLILFVTVVAVRTISLLTAVPYTTLMEDSWILNPTNLAVSEP
jgi:hypothetical protein